MRFVSSDREDSEPCPLPCLLLLVLCEVARLARLISDPYFFIPLLIPLIASIVANQSSGAGAFLVSVKHGKRSVHIHGCEAIGLVAAEEDESMLAN